MREHEPHEGFLPAPPGNDGPPTVARSHDGSASQQDGGLGVVLIVAWPAAAVLGVCSRCRAPGARCGCRALIGTALPGSGHVVEAAAGARSTTAHRQWHCAVCRSSWSFGDRTCPAVDLETDLVCGGRLVEGAPPLVRRCSKCGRDTYDLTAGRCEPCRRDDDASGDEHWPLLELDAGEG